MIVRGEAGDRYPWEPITLAQQLRADRRGAPRPRRARVRRPAADAGRETRARGDAASRGRCGPRACERGDHVAVWVPNHIEWILLWLGANSIGAVIVAVNTRYKTEEVAYILRQSDAKLLVMVDEFVGIDYLAMLARLREEDLPELRDVVVIGDAPRHARGTRSSTRAGRRRSTSTRSPTTTRASSSTRRHHRLPEGRRALQPRAAQRVLDLRGDGHRRRPAA